MKITIQKGIPFPSGGCSPTVVALKSMAVGDSFRVPHNGSRSLSSSIWQIAKRNRIKIASRSVMEDGEKWTRIWRVK